MTWISDDGPILQIHASPNTETRDALVAVRLSSKTHIFRPSHRKTPLLESPSNLALDHLSTIASDEATARKHADVALNPWFVQQVAIVDTTGTWIVHEFQSRAFERIARSWHGSVSMVDPAAFSISSDGWARISWILNLSTLLVCTRQHACMFNLSTDGVATISHIELDAFGGSPYILDMLVMAEGGNRDVVALLTTTHILLLGVIDNGSAGASATVKALVPCASTAANEDNFARESSTFLFQNLISCSRAKFVKALDASWKLFSCSTSLIQARLPRDFSARRYLVKGSLKWSASFSKP